MIAILPESLYSDYTDPVTVSHPCTCNQTTIEGCRATWHVEPEPSPRTLPVNRHERRRAQVMIRRTLRNRQPGQQP